MPDSIEDKAAVPIIIQERKKANRNCTAVNLVRQNHQKAGVFLVKQPYKSRNIARLYKESRKCLWDAHMVKKGKRRYTFLQIKQNATIWKGARHGKHFFEKHL